MTNLNGKTAIVTGGAGDGIGGAVSELFADSGANVVIVDIDSSRGTLLVNQIASRHERAQFIHADVTEPEVPGRVVEQILEVYGRVDILVNNVGGSFGVTLEDADETTIEKNLRSNLISALIFTKMVVPAMISQRQGAVVFVSSINALLGGFSEIAYSAAKAGLHAAARGLTADYGPYGIRFNVVCPGSVPREGGAWARREQESPGTIDRLNRIYPLGRFGTPKDVAHGILYLASDEAAWVSGVVLPIDGGLTATGRLPGGHWWENI